MWIEQDRLLSMRDESVMASSWLVISAKYVKKEIDQYD